MGATAIAERFGVGGSLDPANSTLLTNPLSGHTYYAIPPFATVPRDTNPAAWQCLAYKKNTSGTVAPTHTSVIFRRVKQLGDANPTVGSFTFDISNVGVGEVMYVIADGDGNVANPWGVAIAIFVIRSTDGNQPIDGWNNTNIIFCPLASNVWDGGPEIISWNDLSVQASGSGSGASYPPGTPGIDPNSSLVSFFDWSAFCFTAGTGLPFTTNWWIPDGPGSTDLAWPTAGSWGFPLQSSSGTEIDARMFTYNAQTPGSLPPPSYPIVAHSITDVFFMQLLGEAFSTLGDLGPLRLGYPFGYGRPDVLASKVRPEFIDQTLEAGGGIFLYS